LGGGGEGRSSNQACNKELLDPGHSTKAAGVPHLVHGRLQRLLPPATTLSRQLESSSWPAGCGRGWAPGAVALSPPRQLGRVDLSTTFCCVCAPQLAGAPRASVGLPSAHARQCALQGTDPPSLAHMIDTVAHCPHCLHYTTRTPTSGKEGKPQQLCRANLRMRRSQSAHMSQPAGVSSSIPRSS